MMKQPAKTTPKYGFTLVELMTVIALAGVLTLVVGTLLVSGHRHWNALYNRVHRQEVVDAFATQALFDSIARRASFRKAVISSDGTSLELYYWSQDADTPTPNRFARFELVGTELILERGFNETGAWMPDLSRPTQTFVAASHVDSVQFNTRGASVQMIVRYADTALSPLVLSAVRHNF